MNTSYYKNIDENFSQALNLYECDFTHEQLLSLLKDGNIVQKQISALRTDKLDCQNDADIFINNLTGQDGKVREAISAKINEFLSNQNYQKYFVNDKAVDVFTDAIIDINGNICRNIIDGISNLKSNDLFCERFGKKLVDLIFDLLAKIEQFNFQEGKYKINKEVFKLYWALETLYVFYDRINFSELKQIILRAGKIQEYTIREKTAKILSRNLCDKDLENLKNKLKNDSNYYVRRF